ncbi:hypothetical protein TRIP_B50066 [uncultured Desulfatiglans sp.]|nr:hypothetical protein TRIP_B50066 [uncultured Desulfatiglans sp.]
MVFLAHFGVNLHVCLILAKPGPGVKRWD